MVNTFQGKPLDWWFINLSSRTDRRDHAEQQFAKQGITANRFEAFLPEEWNGPAEQVQRIKNRTPGAIGCYMSQIEVMRTCDADSIVAVCEDDVVFAPDMADRIRYAESALPEDWDVFYLGATFHVPGEWYKDPECASWGHRGVDAEQVGDSRIMRVFGMWGTYAYFVNGAKMEKVVDLLQENCHRSDGIDHNFMELGDKVNAYCMVPGMAWQYDNQSNIGHGVTMFSGFKKLGPYVWADDMYDFDPNVFNWETGEAR